MAFDKRVLIIVALVGCCLASFAEAELRFNSNEICKKMKNNSACMVCCGAIDAKEFTFRQTNISWGDCTCEKIPTGHIFDGDICQGRKEADDCAKCCVEHNGIRSTKLSFIFNKCVCKEN